MVTHSTEVNDERGCYRSIDPFFKILLKEMNYFSIEFFFNMTQRIEPLSISEHDSKN